MGFIRFLIMANITATANFKKAKRAERNAYKEFSDFMLYNAPIIWEWRKKREYDEAVVYTYFELLAKIDIAREDCKKATEAMNEVPSHNLKVA